MRKTMMAAVGLALGLGACQKPAPQEQAARPDAVAIAQAMNAKSGAPQTAGGATQQIVSTTTAAGLKLKLPAPSVTASGRTATVSLPYRGADGLIWKLAPGPTGPWAMQSNTVTPGGGGEGADMAVFVFKASAPGAATLIFRLAPPASGTSSEGAAKTYQATVSAS